MRSSKKVIIAIMIMLVLLLCVGGAFAYVYLATDILKTDQELFFKYFAQITSEDGFIDSGIKNFYEKKKQTPYENSGEITVDVEYPEESLTTIIDKVNDLAIRLKGKVDSVNQKVEQNIEVDYGNNVVFPINYRQDENKFGLQIEKLSKQFIAIRNENLDELAKKIGIEEAVGITQSQNFELTEIVEMIKFTEDEKNQLKQTYGDVLKQQLLEENFSSIKTKQDESYTLDLSNEQIKNIIVKILEATKQNTLIIDKINDIILQYDSEAEKIEVSQIDDLIDEVNEVDFSTLPNLKLTLVQSNKQLNQIIIQFGESKITMQKNNVGNNLSYTFNCLVKGTMVESNILSEETSDSGEYNVYLSAQYSGLDSLSNVQESYEIGFDISAEDEDMGYNYKINSNTAFVDSVLIETLNDDVAVFLNDHNDEQVTKFLTQVGTKIMEINKNQMTELGLKEYENPLLYSNPITTLVMTIFNSASDAITDNDMSMSEVETFNNQFTKYVGDELKGSEVNAMINTVLTNNLSYEGQSDKIIKVTVDGNEISSAYSVDTSSVYLVEAVYNDSGYITEMKVTTKN